ncbi:MAG: polymerase sigma factor [Ferruginibacter sp.]|nr:polymerase sigma factor [Ferruginibacter sp.]
MDYTSLVKDCLKKRPAAQQQLYEHFAPAMLGVCYRYTKSMQDAEDVLQEGFIKVFFHLDKYKATGELGAWIRRIMVTTALNYLKKNKRYREELVFAEMPLHPVSDNNPVIQLDAKQLSELIRQLPIGYQTVFNLYAIEGYTHVEIGAMLGISEGTSKSQYARARYLLIEWIEKYSSLSKQEQYAGK